MENFIVSARKYRPQNFSTVVGQEHITTTLKNAINNNQLAHAFLFCGPRGVGKTTCARILAKTINCENRSAEGEACNTCNSCLSFDHGTSLNIHELDAASNNSVDDIRTLVDQVRFAPQAGKYKVYIVDEVHMLSASAFNAFLKTLEEPPSYAIFILATTEKHKILPTILSRCQIFDFKRITNQDTVAHLEDIAKKESIKAERSALHLIAQKSEGCLRDSLSILDKIVSFTSGELSYKNTLEHLNILDEDYYFRLISFMQNGNISDAILMYDEINRKGFEGDMVLNGFAEFVRNVLVSKDPKVASLLEVSDDFKPKYVKAAKEISPAWLISALNVLNEAEMNFKQARNKRLHVELTLIKLCYLSEAIDLVANETGSGKKKHLESVKPVAFRAIRIVAKQEKKSTPANTSKDERSEPSEAKLTIITESPEPVAAKTSNGIVVAKPVVKLGKLSKIREQVAHQQKCADTTIKELNDDHLRCAWDEYIERLKQNNNPSAVTNFKSAKLSVIDNNNIEILVEGNLQQKFIEAERAGLIEHLRNYFNNRSLMYNFRVVQPVNTTPVERPLTVKEQYAKLVEEYPLIKELKERLNLSLD
jgi:DNA polymerase III subunit gamma/tau